MRRGIIVITLITLAILATPFLTNANAQKGCHVGEDHDDNKASWKLGRQMINDGASACELAKACDAMQIKIKVDSDDLQSLPFYKNANDKTQEELGEVAEDGHGADGVECYEMEYAVNGDK